MPDPSLPRHAHRSPIAGTQNVGCFATYDPQMILHLQKSVTAADRSGLSSRVDSHLEFTTEGSEGNVQ